MRIFASGVDWAPQWVIDDCDVHGYGPDYDGELQLPIWDECVWGHLMDPYRRVFVDEGLAADPRFEKNQGRVANRGELEGILEATIGALERLHVGVAGRDHGAGEHPGVEAAQAQALALLAPDDLVGGASEPRGEFGAAVVWLVRHFDDCPVADRQA